jgi:hypothetical protein
MYIKKENIIEKYHLKMHQSIYDHFGEEVIVYYVIMAGKITEHNKTPEDVILSHNEEYADSVRWIYYAGFE